MRLEGKSAVVTGASSGIGRAIAELFAKEGANVIAVARRAERLNSLVESLSSAPGKIIPYVGDVTRQGICEGMIDEAVKQFGKLDILVNNAGIMDDMSPIGEMTNERFEKVYAVNVFAPAYAMRKAVSVFLAQDSSGSIVNITSDGCVKTVAGPIYCSSKAAVVALTRNTAFMYMPNKIRCNAIAPGSIATEINNSMGIPNMAGYAQVKRVLTAAPDELGKPEDIANAALFFASDESHYVSGDVMFVDGGWHAG